MVYDTMQAYNSNTQFLNPAISVLPSSAICECFLACYFVAYLGSSEYANETCLPLSLFSSFRPCFPNPSSLSVVVNTWAIAPDSSYVGSNLVVIKYHLI